MSNYFSLLYRVLIFSGLVVYNVYFLYDSNYSSDFFNYQSIYENPSFHWLYVEPAFLTLATLFNTFLLDFRWIFFANIILFLLFFRRGDKTATLILTFILCSPYTPFGMNNTVLSFTASLLVVYALLSNNKLIIVLSIFVHKGALIGTATFLNPNFKNAIGFGLLALVGVFFVSGYIGYGGAYSVSMDTFVFRLVMILFPFFVVWLFSSSCDCSRLFFMFYICCLVFFFDSKVADRLLYVVATVSLYYLASNVSKIKSVNYRFFSVILIVFFWSPFFFTESVLSQF